MEKAARFLGWAKRKISPIAGVLIACGLIITLVCIVQANRDDDREILDEITSHHRVSVRPIPSEESRPNGTTHTDPINPPWVDNPGAGSVTADPEKPVDRPDGKYVFMDLPDLPDGEDYWYKDLVPELEVAHEDDIIAIDEARIWMATFILNDGQSVRSFAYYYSGDGNPDEIRGFYLINEVDLYVFDNIQPDSKTGVRYKKADGGIFGGNVESAQYMLGVFDNLLNGRDAIEGIPHLTKLSYAETGWELVKGGAKDYIPF